MKSLAIIFVAVVALTGCGVGVDENADGTPLATQEQGLITREGDISPPITSANPSTTRDPGTVALPQDPIPLFEGKPVLPPPGTDLKGQMLQRSTLR